jgi:hypothetical protein
MYLKLGYCLLTIMALSSCGGTDPKEIIGDADRVKLYLFMGDTIVPVLDDTGAIKEELIKAICSGNAETNKCGYKGRIEYYQGDSLLLSGDYNISPGCNNITYVHKGERYYKELTKEGRKLLYRYQLPKPTDLHWLAGTWVAEQAGERPVYEEWQKAADGSLRGRSFVMYAGDTTINEQLQIKQQNGYIYYIAIVAHNDNKPVYFEMQPQLTDSEFVFTNALHDFPQQILYRRIDVDSLLAVVSGGDSQFEVGMKRVK